MTDRGRRFAAIGMLIASCAAILATTPGEPTATAAVEGDVGVGPNEPAEIVVRFVVAPSDQIDRGSIRFSSGFANYYARSTVSGEVTAVADGVILGSGDQGLALPVRECRDGCEVELRALLTWSGAPDDRLRARWNAELDVVYENSVPSGEPVTATIGSGHGPPAGRNVWLLVGVVAAALAATASLTIGSRLARVRIGLAALAALPPLWLLVQFAGLPDPFRFIDAGDLTTLGTSIMLIIGTVVGVVLTLRGNPVALPAAGWAYLVIVGFYLWLVIGGFTTYRPHEVALLSLALLIPGVAALTAIPPNRAPAPVGVRFGTAFVLASVLAEFLVSGAIAVYLVVVAVVLSVGSRPVMDPATIGFGLVPIVVTICFVLGIRLWWSGSRPLLGLASTLTLLVFVPLLLSIFGGQGGILVIADVPAAAVLICFAVNVLGLIGLVIFPTPAEARPRAPQPDDERHEERGQRQQVARVLYEADVEGGGDRA